MKTDSPAAASPLKLLASLEIPALWIDESRLVIDFTPSATDVWKIGDADRGRPLDELPHHAIAMPPIAALPSVDESGGRAVETIQTVDGRWWQRKVVPVGEPGDPESGVLVSFHETAASHGKRQWEHHLGGLCRSVDVGFCVLDARLRVWSCNDRLATMFGIAGQPADGCELAELLPGQLVEKIACHARRAMQQGEPCEDVELDRPAGRDAVEHSRWLASFHPLLESSGGSPSGGMTGVCLVLRDVSDLRGERDRLRRYRQRLRLALEAGGMGVWEWDVPSDAVLWTDELYRLLGTEPGAQPASLQRFLDLVHPQDRHRVEQAINAHLYRGEGHCLDCRVVRPSDGRTIWVNCQSDVEFASTGVPQRMIGIITDITQRKQAEQSLRESEQFARRTLESLSVFAAVCTVDGRLVQANPAVLQTIPLPPEEILGLPLEETYWWSHDPGVQQQLREALRKAAAGEASRFDIDVRIAGEERLTVDFQIAPLRDSAGRITHLLASAIDITERLQHQRAVLANQQQLRLAAGAAAFGTYDMDAASGQCQWSAEMKSIFGLAADAETPVGFGQASQMVHPADRARVETKLAQSLDPRGSGRFVDEHRIVREDGHVRWLLIKGQTLFDDEGDERQAVRTVGVAVDITERKKAEDGFRKSERIARRQLAELEAIYETAPIGLCVLDAELRFVRVNRRWAAISGLPPERHLGRTVRDVLPALADRIEPAMREILETGRAVHGIELSGKTPASPEEERIWRESWYPLRDSDGRVVGINIVAEDVTDNRRYQQQLREARKAAEAANRSKDEFLANMSHEIRTPMTAILGYADLLSAEMQSADHLQSIDVIRRNGRHLLEILNDILDLSKIEAGRLDLSQSRFSPWELVKEVRDLMEVRAQQKGLPVEIEVEGALPAAIRSDPTRLRQILMNLIGNAIKFTERGEVRVRLRLDRAHEQLEFSVIDTGPGIRPDQLERLFQPFSQLDGSTTRRHEGSGLGLAISRRLAEKLGGTIAVSSRVGRGSTFTVCVATGSLEDVKLGEPDEFSGAERPCAAGDGLVDCRILVVDDQRDIRYLARRILEREGAWVETLENGREAVERIDEFNSATAPLRVVLMDVQMPEMDGYEASRRLRSSGFDRPIIALTANAMRGDREKCLEAGFTDYLSKPLDSGELIAMLQRVVGDSPAS